MNKKKEKNNEIYFYAQENKFSKKNNEIPKEFENKIICSDNLVILKKLPDNCIDLIFTSPPYNFGLDYSDNSDSINWNTYFENLFEMYKSKSKEESQLMQ